MARLIIALAAVALPLAAGAAWATRAPEPLPPKAPQLAFRPPAASAPELAPEPAPRVDLPALRFTNVNSREAAQVALYDAQGHVSEAAAEELERLLADARDPKQPVVAPLDRRTLQLVFRSAYHFRVSEVLVISAYRQPGRRRQGLHEKGLAIDYKLPGVPAATLASYLRTHGRVGVGVYTHPKTQYVHLDVREQSYHWLDASPPRKHWREMSIGNSSLPARDRAYERSQDWPEGVEPPR